MSFSDGFKENLVLALQCLGVAVIIRAVFILSGSHGYVPVLDDIIDLVLDGIQLIGGAISGNFRITP